MSKKTMTIEGGRTRNSQYAASGDFCSLFERNMAAFYRLALLLTADEEAAYQVFVSSLEECLSNEFVFEPWAHSWARRTIIYRAMRATPMASPEPTVTDRSRARKHSVDGDERWTRIVELGALDRFAFVLTVLERFTDRECAAVFGCAVEEVARARVRALGELASGDRVASLRPLDCQIAQTA